MNIGIFDSGLGGLLMTMSILQELPEYSYLYLGDTKRLPYGNRTQEEILQFTTEAVEFLFERNCKLIIIACNTASSEALRTIQQQYLPAHYPDRRVLGVLVPTAEEAVQNAQKIGVLATASTVESQSFIRELKKANPAVEVIQQAAPELVSLIENDEGDKIEAAVARYLEPLLAAQIDTLVLGCTHYALIKDTVRRLAPNCTVISQDELLPKKVRSYLERHPEIERDLTRSGERHFMVTDLQEGYQRVAGRFAHEDLNLEVVDL